jgi:hypothetical protein
MSEMGSHDPFEHMKHKLWSKEGPWVESVIWFPTTKSQESPWFPCVEVMCDILLESSRRGLQLCFKLHFNRRSSNKVMRPQSRESPNFGNFGIPTWESREKCHLDVGPVVSHRIYYKGEGGGFSQVRVVVSLVNLSLPMARPNTQSVLAMH